ncbi:MAG TPA: NAD(P)/FAD-dependent oxidoreductase [Candidatus Dormibacteraeota bacterium]
MGAGPAGLAVAAEARRHGLTTQILDAAEAVGASWRGHYNRLRLHTTRGLSGLPGVPIPARLGRWIARDDFVAYLEHYARRVGVPIRLGVRVERIDLARGGWSLTTSAGQLEAGQVVVATGHNHTPRLPDWPGRSGFTGELTHSSGYRSPAPYSGRDVLVVGAGNSGAEIAADLVEGGARKVWISIRTPPNIVRRDGPAGIAPQHLGILMRPLPLKIVDPLSLLVQKVVIGDLSKYGIAAPASGVATRVLEGHIPLIDVGFLAQLKAGRIEVVPGVTGFDGSEVICGERRLTADAVIAATGYSPGLEPMVGHLGVLDGNGRPRFHAPQCSPQAAGLFFIGYSNPISGNLREIAHDARALGPVLAAEAARTQDSVRAS